MRQPAALRKGPSRRGIAQLSRVPERVVQRDVVQLLRTVGAHVYVLGTVRPKGDTPGTRQTPGIPDVFAILPISTLWVEVKAEGGRLRPEQAAFRDHCRRVGQPHVVGGVDEVIAHLKGEGLLT